MTFDNLIGLHMLSGLETSTEKMSDYSDYFESSATVIYFIVDGITYRAQEDPEDGYRSMMGSFEIVTDYVVKNTFPEQQVLGKLREPGYYNHDIIDFFDVVTSKNVLSLGTDSYDDYYPSFVFEWNPENMAINVQREADRLFSWDNGS